jgi:hypothetical protein
MVWISRCWQRSPCYLPGKERSRLPVSEKPVFEKLESAYLNPGIEVVINVLEVTF